MSGPGAAQRSLIQGQRAPISLWGRTGQKPSRTDGQGCRGWGWAGGGWKPSRWPQLACGPMCLVRKRKTSISSCCLPSQQPLLV